MGAKAERDSLDSARSLVSQLEQLTENDGSPLPTLQQMFAIGALLFRIGAQSSSDLPTSCQRLIEALPKSYLTTTFGTYQTALTRLLSQKPCDDDLIDAATSLCGFFSNSPKLCQTVYSKDWISSLAALYDRMILQHVNEESKRVVLSSISFLILDGLFLPPQGNNNFEDQLLQAIRAMEENSTECLHDLQDWQAVNEPHQRSLVASVQTLPHSAHNDEDESNIQQLREYILDMLESARQKEQSQQPKAALDPSKSTVTTRNKDKAVSPADELERRIQQVKQILPDFGEGFLESALSLYQGNVETTVSILLNDHSQYPPSLRILDKNLPRRLKLRAEQEAKDTAEARQLVKERVAIEHDREQQRYKALLYVAERDKEEENHQLAVDHNEYDDDYDDQYDEVDVKLGGADDGMYDFEQIKLYNQAAREDEAEASFWEQNRNQNRQSAAGNKKESEGNNGGDGKQYRGPNKLKGGRVVGADGKIVQNSRGRGKRSNANNNSTSGQHPSQAKPNPSASAGGPHQHKTKTKAKSSNRINRQRDKKQKAQGTFGTQS